MKKDKVLFIVTGTICPEKDVTYTKLLDADKRLNQYIESIKYLINSGCVSGIIFCDNSNYDYDFYELTNQASHLNVKLELLKYTASPNLMKYYGKGAGELDIIEYIFGNSALIHEYDSFFKITGRLKIKNVKSVIGNASENVNYFQVYRHDWKHMPYVDTVFYKIKKSDYLKLKLDKYLINDSNGTYLENIFYDRLNNGLISYNYFNTYPIKTGISGSSLVKYDESWRTVLLKSILSKFNLMDRFDDIIDYYLSLKKDYSNNEKKY